MEKLKIKKALITVSDKRKLDTLAQCLNENGVEMIATGGTFKYLYDNGFPVEKVENVNNQPEAFDGRVKTLGFHIFGGILFNRDNQKHIDEAKKYGVSQIDLVVCNLYPFVEVSKKDNIKQEDLIENIDIGGVSLIRAAAKNFKNVTLLSSVNQYDEFIKVLNEKKEISLDLRKKLSLKGFLSTYYYDQSISLTLAKEFQLDCEFELLSSDIGEQLRYGENPHQKARLVSIGDGLAQTKQIQGKQMSYNNFLDAQTAIDVVKDLSKSQIASNKFSVSIVKHGNPCGVSISENQLEAIKSAWSGDPVSSFGSILCFNKTVEKEASLWLEDKFVEVILAPNFSSEALESFSKKKIFAF